MFQLEAGVFGIQMKTLLFTYSNVPENTYLIHAARATDVSRKLANYDRPVW